MLSSSLRARIGDFIEEAEKQERLIEEKDVTIQAIVTKCEQILLFEPLTKVGRDILTEIIREYREAI